MGIETIIAIAGLAAAAAGTGAEVYQSQQAAGDAKKARNDEQAALGRRQAELANAQAQNDATAAARVARLRMRAGLAGNDQTIATSPLGLSTGAAPAGPQPLKTLGA